LIPPFAQVDIQVDIQVVMQVVVQVTIIEIPGDF